jgi:hypothetical protein
MLTHAGNEAIKESNIDLIALIAVTVVYDSEMTPLIIFIISRMADWEDMHCLRCSITVDVDVEVWSIL